MKILPLILMLSLYATCGFTQALNNGAYVENGKTIEIDKTLHQFTPTNAPEILYFSNELIAKIYTNSDFTVNSFYQEIQNIAKPAEKAKFGGHNFAATLMNGTAVIFYSGGSSNSSCIVSTPLTDIELHDGIFYFKVSEKQVLVAVVDGSFTAHNDKNKTLNVSGVGNAALAVQNDVGILEAKVSIRPERVKKPIIEQFMSESIPLTKLKGTIMFTVIGGKIVGVIID